MELAYRDRAIVLGDVLVLADLHVGKGATANLEIPVGDNTDMIERFEALVAAHEPATAVVAGDFLHSFGTIPRTVEETVESFERIGDEYGVDVVVTPGNHDPMIESVWNGPTQAEYRVGDTVVLHGHEAPEATAERYVVGHDHPTIVIEGKRRPCYLYGEGVYRGADVVMVPPFNRLVRGVRVNGMYASDFRSPLVRSVDEFRPIVRDEDGDETLEFPPLGEFRRML
jgi:putative SbcD/Mre11-related phosphoesterase